ncbi:MAG: glycosyltransferase, partial [Chloroflexi bacterium]
MKRLRVLHLIDSLAAGGAERMAVNLCNLLNERGTPAWLCATRAEGPLLEMVADTDRYIFLEKRNALDFRAFTRLIRFIRRERINVLHAHSSSLAWAVMAKYFADIKVVWHDHFGNSEFLDSRARLPIRLFTRSVDYVISVNEKLQRWAIEKLNIDEDKVSYLPNFPMLSPKQTRPDRHSKRDIPVIICTANLRAAKDHHTLIKALALVRNDGIPFKLWLVGADFNDTYSRSLKQLIHERNLSGDVEFLGVRTDITDLLCQADIGVLSSVTEGLPVSLLEYGLAGLPVVATAVGQVPEVVGECGVVVPPKDVEALAAGLKKFLCDKERRRQLGKKFNERVEERYSAAPVYDLL